MSGLIVPLQIVVQLVGGVVLFFGLLFGAFVVGAIVGWLFSREGKR